MPVRINVRLVGGGAGSTARREGIDVSCFQWLPRARSALFDQSSKKHRTFDMWTASALVKYLEGRAVLIRFPDGLPRRREWRQNPSLPKVHLHLLGLDRESFVLYLRDRPSSPWTDGFESLEMRGHSTTSGVVMMISYSSATGRLLYSQLPSRVFAPILHTLTQSSWAITDLE